jgi:hypothetical protein
MTDNKKKDGFFILASSPEDDPIALDLDSGELYLNKKESEEGEKVMSLTIPNGVATTSTTALALKRPDWMSEFFTQMDDYVGSSSKNAKIDENGQLHLAPNITASDIKAVCGNLTWLYEAQYRQNKEILLWIGEIILDHIARSTDDVSIEGAIEDLGFLSRENGFRWKLKTLVKWPIVVKKIPIAIRQLPIPATYLTEAAMFGGPDDLNDKIKFNNARDALLISVSQKPDSWSRERFVNCMKELQEKMGIERNRTEGISALRERLISYYRLKSVAESSGDPKGFCERQNLDYADINQWIYSIEGELICRGKLDPIPENSSLTGDGLTQAARLRLEKNKDKLEKMKVGEE